MDIVGKVNRLVLWVGYLAWGPLWGCSKSCLQLKALKVKFLFWCLMLGKVADAAAPFLCAPASFLEKETLHQFQSLLIMYLKVT